MRSLAHSFLTHCDKEVQHTHTDLIKPASSTKMWLTAAAPKQQTMPPIPGMSDSGGLQWYTFCTDVEMER
jgi:acyl-CoA synthetase (AMP-forming)/AMP-acid ligase II